jgi:hypothetical protein
LIDFRKDAREWLRNYSREVMILMAVRAALRALLEIANRPPHEVHPRSALAAFRCVGVPWVLLTDPTAQSFQQRLRRAAHGAANAATDSAYGEMDGRIVTPPAAALYVAASAAETAAVEARANADKAAVAAVTYGHDRFLLANSADAAFIEAWRGDSSVITKLVAAPLWSSDFPEWPASRWEQLKSDLVRANQGWEVWIDWYEDRLAGRPSDPRIDLAKALFSDELWKQGPKAVNIEIRRLMDEAPSDSIPQQGPGPHFMLGPAGTIVLVPPAEIDALGNNVVRIHQLLPIVRRAAEDLFGRLNPNAFPELARNVADYRAAVAEDETQIAWGVVFGLGVMLENSAEAAQRKINNRLDPPLEDAIEAALNSLLTLHGPLILATAEGRELVEEADRMRLTRQEQARLREDAQAVAGQLKIAKAIIEPPAAKVVAEAADVIGESRHPEYGTVYGIGTVKNVAIGVVGVAAVSATLGVGAVEAGAAFLAIESLKKSNTFSAVTSMLGQHVDRVFRVGIAYQRFIIANQSHFAVSRPTPASSAGCCPT